MARGRCRFEFEPIDLAAPPHVVPVYRWSDEEGKLVCKLERSIKEGNDMASTITNIRLEDGTLRRKNLSARVWFKFISNTGAELPLKQHGESMVRTLYRPTGGFQGKTTRKVIMEYRLVHPCRIKMVNNCSAFGSLNQIINIYIDLDPNAAALEFNGVEDFGLFQGRGVIDFKASTFTEHHREHEMNEDIMKQFFGLRCIQPPRGVVTGKRKVRSLLY